MIDRDPAGEGLRAFIIRRDWDLRAFGGYLELFAAARAVMAARPERRMWNRTQLAALWGDIGEHGLSDEALAGAIESVRRFLAREA